MSSARVPSGWEVDRAEALLDRRGETVSWRRVVLLHRSVRGLREHPGTETLSREVQAALAGEREELLADPGSLVLPHAAALVLEGEVALGERAEDWLTHLARGESVRWSRSRAGWRERLRARALVRARTVPGPDRVLLVSDAVPSERSELARVGHRPLLVRGGRAALVVAPTVAEGQDGDAGSWEGLGGDEFETVLELWEPGGAGPLRTGAGARAAGARLHR